MQADPLALARAHPELSASQPVSRGQKIFITTACLLVIAASAWKPGCVARTFVAFSTLFYLVFTLYKLLLLRLSLTHDPGIRPSRQELADCASGDLPIYSILVPLYHEPESVAGLVKSLGELDYPDDRKDVQLLLEEDDRATRAAADAVDLPRGFRITLVPESHPRTKPKACNIGLAKARGRYLVIYDAEDRPEPDQLLKAVAAFAGVGPETVCLQSMLNFYNPRQNLMTRLFCAEYSSWFDLSLPGLSALGAVIPLGGTSNHFVTERLREMLGWDAYNVTEDCDLGVRIYRRGFTTRMLDATTWEEACSSLPYWIRQRTRWIKGYIQTYFVHMRAPLRLLRELGPAGFCHFQLLVGGIIFSFLINPFFWFLALLWFVLRPEMLTALFPGPVFAVGALCLFAGNFAFTYMGAIGCFRRGHFDLVSYSLLAPFYWVLMSFSAWRALLQFFANPFYWEKTKHGMQDNKQS